MSRKLFALGNVLMMDDGVGVAVVKQAEDALTLLDIEVIYGETDVGYCISRLEQNDFIILVDAARLGKEPGRITSFLLEDFAYGSGKASQHNFNLLDLIRIYYPEMKGMVYAIEISEIGLHYGLSPLLEDKRVKIAEELISLVRKDLLMQSDH